MSEIRIQHLFKNEWVPEGSIDNNHHVANFVVRKICPTIHAIHANKLSNILYTVLIFLLLSSLHLEQEQSLFIFIPNI